MAKDAQNNTISGITFFWASSNQNAALVDQTGLATGVAGGTVTISALGLGVPGSAALTVTGVVPTQLAFTTQPTSSTAGAAISPVVEVEVRDASGNRVPTARDPVTLAITGGGATLVGTTNVNAVNGVASFGVLSVQKAGTAYTLTASSGTLTTSVSTAFDIAPASPAKLAFTVQPILTEGSQAIPTMKVEVRDLFDNLVTTSTNTVTLSLSANPGGATLSGTLALPAASGVATFSNVLIDRPQTGYTLTGSAEGILGTTSVPFNVRLSFTAVDAGGGQDSPYENQGDHTCGVTIAGAVYCWGGNGRGQLGDGTTTRRLTPVLALAPSGVTFGSISAGWHHTCAVALTPVAGDVYCWGRNENGRLGDGTQADRSVPGRVAAPSGVTFLSVSAGGQHTCAVAAGTRDVYCWGKNQYGQLGDNTTIGKLTPVRVNAPVGVIFNTVTAGGQHSCGMATSGGVAYCWGWNQYGQLGDSTNTFSSLPSRVKPPTATFVFFTAVTAGQQHTCGRTSAGAVWCWGQNANGQLGDNTIVSKNGPAAVQQGALSFAEVSAGNEHTCARTSAGAGYCWGKNAYGQLGDGSLSNDLVPTLTQGGLILTRSAAGAQHTCGLASGASAGVWCWGLNQDGQLGDGTAISRVQPVRTVQ